MAVSVKVQLLQRLYLRSLGGVVSVGGHQEWLG